MNVDKIINEDIVSLENIAFQKDDKVVKTIEDIFKQIFDFIETNNIKDSKTLYKKSDFKRLRESLDEAIFKRFKIKSLHLENIGTPYAVYPTPPTNNTIYKDFDFIFRDLKSTYTGNTSKDPKNSEDYNAIGNNLVKNYKSIRDSMSKNGIKINLTNATIEGLNEDYVVNFVCDFVLLKEHVTPIEATAILMHEIGHAFTHISLSYQSVRQNTALVESLLEASKKGEEVEKIIELSIGKDTKLTDKDVKIRDEKDQIALIARITENQMLKIFDMDGRNMSGSVGSELIADQFSSRFGLGGDLATGLEKVTIKMEKDTMIFDLVLDVLMGMRYLTMVGSLGGLIGNLMGLVIGGVITRIVMTNAIEFVFGNEKINDKVYDQYKDRMKRIKLDMIRSLKNTKLDNNDKKTIIEKIERVENIINNSSNNKTVMGALGNAIFWWRKSMYKRAILDDKLEELMENDAFVEATKININKRG